MSFEGSPDPWLNMKTCSINSTTPTVVDQTSPLFCNSWQIAYQIWIGFGDLRFVAKDLGDVRKKGCIYCRQD